MCSSFILLNITLWQKKFVSSLKTLWSVTSRTGHVSIFLALRQRQRDNVIELQGQEKNRQRLRPWCLDGKATTYIVINNAITNNLWPENKVTLSRQCCSVPSSGNLIDNQLDKKNTVHYRVMLLRHVCWPAVRGDVLLCDGLPQPLLTLRHLQLHPPLHPQAGLPFLIADCLCT